MAAAPLCLRARLAQLPYRNQPGAPVPAIPQRPLPHRRHRPAGEPRGCPRARDRRRADAGARGAGADPQGGGRSFRHQARTGGADMIRLAAISGFSLLCASLALAQGYPNKPIRLMIGYTAGGSAEAGAPPLARALAPLLGQPLAFEYPPGNAGGAATEAIARAPNDGYTIYYLDSGPLAVAPHLTTVGYNNLTSFTHLGHVCGGGSLLVVHPSAPIRSVQDVIDLSKKEPNKWSYGTSGVGGPHHLSGEYFKAVTGANLLHVPYKGGGPAMTDLMGGQVPMLFSSLAPSVGAVKSGKIRPLAVTSPKRAAAFPDVPTMQELGHNFDSTAWYGLAGPAGLPQEVIAKWTQVLAKAGADKPTVDAINATGCDVNILSPAQTVERIRADHEKWGKVVKDASIKAD